MAVTSITTCDLHNSDAPKATSHTFSVDNRRYEIDLCPQHLAQLSEAIQTFTAAARRSGARTSNVMRRRGVAATPANRVSEIREWARRNGMNVSAKGRIPVSIMQAYENAGDDSDLSSMQEYDTAPDWEERSAPAVAKSPGRPRVSGSTKTAAARTPARRGKKSDVSVSLNGDSVKI